MPLSASASPSSGQTPGSFTVTASGGMQPYSLAAKASPPNPNPMPDYDIVPHPGDPTKWNVLIKDDVPVDTELFFMVTDADADSVTVSYTSTG